MCSDICLMRIWDYIEPELKHGELKIMYNVTLRKKNKNQGKHIFNCTKIRVFSTYIKSPSLSCITTKHSSWLALNIFVISFS